MKNHPTPEEWMSFLYGEDSATRQAECRAHLRDCPECQQQWQTWRGSMAALDAWSVLPAPSRHATSPSRPRWPAAAAAAAAVLLAVGIAVGRLTASSSADARRAVAALRSEMESKLAGARDQLIQDLQLHQAELAQTIHAAAIEAASEETQQALSKFANALDQRREADHEAYVAALKQIEEQRLTDYATLRTALDTVAVNADDGLSQAHEQLMELATVARPTDH